MDQEQAKEEALRERETRQLRRLEVFMDVIFAVVLWRFFTFLPKPDEATFDSVTWINVFPNSISTPE